MSERDVRDDLAADDEFRMDEPGARAADSGNGSVHGSATDASGARPAESGVVTSAADGFGADGSGVGGSGVDGSGVGEVGVDEFVGRWRQIQVGFVDEPRRAVQDADSLVAGLLEQLTATLANDRREAEAQWARTDQVSTEELRVSLQRYRAIFERLIAV